MTGLSYSLHDIRAHFDRGTFSRGEKYADTPSRVREVVYDSTSGRLRGLVRGSYGAQYVTEVVLQPEGRFLTDCTCPVGVDCKHAAALLLFARARPEKVRGVDGAAEALPKGRVVPGVPASSGPSALDPAVGRWLNTLAEAATPSASAGDASAPPRLTSVVYALTNPTRAGDVRVEMMLATNDLLAGTGTGGLLPMTPDMLLRSPPGSPICTPQDLEIAGLLNAFGGRVVPSAIIGMLLPRLLETGRLWWEAACVGPPLRWTDAPTPARPDWQVLPDGRQRPTLGLPEGVDALLCAPPLAVDPRAGRIGPLVSAVPLALLRRWLDAPDIAPEAAGAVGQRLATLVPAPAARPADAAEAPPAVLPAPRALSRVTGKATRITPHLRLRTIPCRWFENWRQQEAPFPVAELLFAYDDAPPQPYGATEPVALPIDPATQEIRFVERNRRRENEAMRALMSAGDMAPLKNIAASLRSHLLLEAKPRDPALFIPRMVRNRAGLEEIWLAFVLEAVPQLRQQGFQIEFDPDFPFDATAPDDWYSDLEDSGSGTDWFDFHLGVTVDGEKVDLVPTLLRILREERGTGRAASIAPYIADVAQRKTMVIRTVDGRTLALPGARVAALLRFLVTVTDGSADAVRVSRANAVDLAELQAALAASEARWFRNDSLRQLGQSLRQGGGVPVAPLPAGVRATLRPYQHEGYSWLRFLQAQRLGGILADDMGLGKTLQTLTYVQAAKEAGELAGKPVLIVAPTSLVFNWQSEAAQFCPDLRVLPLQGADRRQRFAAMGEADLVISTYALLSFDKEELLRQTFHTIILDEAQYIKNARAKSTLIATQLRADHRFCLSGTPLENHLGEIWSLFNFLMPGFLGDAAHFQKHCRLPIEKHRDADAEKHLLRRVQPFMLRRTKEAVAKELPPKSEIVQYCDLSGPQRDLYEAVRLRMHSKVRQEIAARGLARSQIIVLDALLKLRQVSCHPPLMKGEDARRIKGSAKLETLLDLLETLIEEGRRIVLFSQFVEMLEVIAGTLRERGVSFVMLTGSSRNRGDLVKTFQSGAAQVFLVSLKAGGVGLNLTAADTVIHYDPWWNPAAERQAADRVYRIGQDKPVFVYKLIARDTVEEKILALQQRKQELADALFSEDGATMARLSPEDIEGLLAA